MATTTTTRYDDRGFPTHLFEWPIFKSFSQSVEEFVLLNCTLDFFPVSRSIESLLNLTPLSFSVPSVLALLPFPFFLDFLASILVEPLERRSTEPDPDCSKEPELRAFVAGGRTLFTATFVPRYCPNTTTPKPPCPIISGGSAKCSSLGVT